MKKYKVFYDCAGWLEFVIVEARNKKDARRASRVTKIIRIEQL